MSLSRRIRGLLGTALTWGVAGALVGVAAYVVRYQPWQFELRHWPRALQLLGMFVGAAGLWGAACGLAFAATVALVARRTPFERLSARRFAWWGAMGGAAFPLVMYTPVVLGRGGIESLPLFGSLTLGSALLGAGVARVALGLARRAPEAPAEPGLLSEPSLSEVPEAVRARHEARR